jgi:AcrR family transcriptional regulator
MNSEPESTSSPVRLDRRAARRQETKAEIVAAGWDLVRANGLSGLAMRDLGERVGMKAQSIYSYFASKHDIYDAMFHEGFVAFADFTGGLLETPDAEPLDQARSMAHQFFEFCTSDPVRYQLLFQRTIPEFVPSDESFAVSVGAYESMATRLADLGITDPAAMDLWTAVLTGLTDQQISNDPGGERWERLIDRAVDMTLRETAPHLFETPKGRN